jgi:3-oxoacid CoA-transferase
MTVLGAQETSASGYLANYMIPGKMVKGMGGAVDLLSSLSTTKVLILQSHMGKHGRPKIKESVSCRLKLGNCQMPRRVHREIAVGSSVFASCWWDLGLSFLR